MPRELYDCTAAELATQPVDHLPDDTSPGEAAAWLSTNGYDAAPIYRDGHPIGFVHAKDIDADTDGDDLTDHLTPLTIDQILTQLRDAGYDPDPA